LFCIVCRYLEENVGALAVQLTADELKELEAAMPADKVCTPARQHNVLQCNPNGYCIRMNNIS
jgi:hypothetical protein